jgi:hypothetical protein
VRTSFWKEFNECNLTHAVYECAVDEHNTIDYQNVYQCGATNPASTTVMGEYSYYALMQLKYNTSKEQFEEAVNTTLALAYKYGTIHYDYWLDFNETEQTYVNFTVDDEFPNAPILNSVNLMKVVSDNGLRPNGSTATDYRYQEFLSLREIPPRVPKGPIEFKLGGNISNEGWLMARWPGGEWGFVSNHAGSTTTQTNFALFVCNNTGNYNPGKLATYWFGMTGHQGAQHIDAAHHEWTSSAYTSLYNFKCAGWTWWTGPDGLNTHCQYRTNIYNHSSITTRTQFAMYFQCANELKFRLAGPIKGIGAPQMFEPNRGVWEGVYAQMANVNQYKWACDRYFLLPPVTGFNPYMSGFIAGTPRWPIRWWYGRLPSATAGIEFTYGWMRYGAYNDQRYVYCREPPLQTIPTGTVVRMLNGAVDTRTGITKEKFIEMVAEIAGTNSSYIIVPLWDDSTKDYNDQVYVSLRIVDLTINVGVAMNAILANTSFNFIATEVRPMPVPNTIPEIAWLWKMEVPNPALPYRGFVWMRPTAHYQWGGMCTPYWTDVHAKVYCATMFGAAVTSWPVAPRYQSFNTIGSHEVFLENLFCSGNESTIGHCSYKFMGTPLAICDGTSTIYIDCRPSTQSVSLSLTLTRSTSPSRTMSLSATSTVTFSASLPPTPSASASASRSYATLSRTVSGATLSGTGSTSATGTFSVSLPPTPSASGTATVSVSATVTPPPTPTVSSSPSFSETASASGSASASESASSSASASGTASEASATASPEATETFHALPFLAISSPSVAVDRLGGAAASAADAARFADSLVATARVYLGHTQPRYASAPLRVEMNVSVTPPLAFDAASVTGGGAPGCALVTPWLVTCRAETAVEAYTPATSLRGRRPL